MMYVNPQMTNWFFLNLLQFKIRFDLLTVISTVLQSHGSTVPRHGQLGLGPDWELRIVDSRKQTRTQRNKTQRTRPRDQETTRKTERRDGQLRGGLEWKGLHRRNRRIDLPGWSDLRSRHKGSLTDPINDEFRPLLSERTVTHWWETEWIVTSFTKVLCCINK